jgi:hypothetical protein
MRNARGGYRCAAAIASGIETKHRNAPRRVERQISLNSSGPWRENQPRLIARGSSRHNDIGQEFLLVISDAAAQIADPGHKAYFRHWPFVGAWSREHILDFSDLTFRLQICLVEVHAKLGAGGVI